jgi:hypothetical protein
VDRVVFVANARRLAEEQGIFTWPGTVATDTPSIRGVELTVGDATLQFTPAEVARIVNELVS